MITQDDYVKAEACTADDLFNSEGVAELMGRAIDLFGNVNPGTAHIVYACLFGALCADSVVAGCESDKTGIVDFEQRLKLFGIHARIAYNASVVFAIEAEAHGKKQ